MASHRLAMRPAPCCDEWWHVTLYAEARAHDRCRMPHVPHRHLVKPPIDAGAFVIASM